LSQANLNQALYDEQTQFPHEFDPVAANLKLRSERLIKDSSTPVESTSETTSSTPTEIISPEITSIPTTPTEITSPEITSPPTTTIETTPTQTTPVKQTSEITSSMLDSNNNSNGKVLNQPAKNTKSSKKYLIPLGAILACVTFLAVIIFQPLVYQWFNNSNSSFTLHPRISSGEKILIEAEGEKNESFKALKQAGVEAFAEGKYERAISYLKLAIKASHNSPETLIYLNNAKIGKQQANTIAVVAPIGRNLYGAYEILRGVAHAQNEFNQSVSGQTLPIKVVIVNDDNREEVAKEVASVLIKAPEVLGVVGHWASQVSLAATDVYKTGNLVSISPISTAVTLSNSSPYFFRLVPKDSIAAKALADYMITHLNRKESALFFSSQSTNSNSLKDEFINAVLARGGKVSPDNVFDFNDSGFSAKRSVEKAIEQSAQVIMLAPNAGSIYKALAVIQVNDKRLPLLGGDEVYGDRTLQDGGAATVGMVVAIAWHVDGTMTSVDFRNQSIELWDTADVNWRTAMSYDAAKVLIAAIQQQSKPTRIGLQQVLSSPEFSATGASGKIQFESSGDRRNPPIQLVKIVKAESPKTGYIFVPVMSDTIRE